MPHKRIVEEFVEHPRAPESKIEDGVYYPLLEMFMASASNPHLDNDDWENVRTFLDEESQARGFLNYSEAWRYTLPRFKVQVG